MVRFSCRKICDNCKRWKKAVKLIDIANRLNENLEIADAKEILKVIGNYSKALELLDDYDHRTLLKPKEGISLVKNI